MSLRPGWLWQHTQGPAPSGGWPSGQREPGPDEGGGWAGAMCYTSRPGDKPPRPGTLPAWQRDPLPMAQLWLLLLDTRQDSVFLGGFKKMGQVQTGIPGLCRP